MLLLLLNTCERIQAKLKKLFGEDEEFKAVQ